MVLDTLVSDMSEILRFALKDVEIIDDESKKVKHGEWIDYDDAYGSLMCSVCEDDAPDDIPWDFCPNCGARMENKE